MPNDESEHPVHQPAAPASVEDNYHAYLEEEFGYAWDAWDTTPMDEVRTHDVLLAADASAIQAADVTTRNDLERWALARAARGQRQWEIFDAAVDAMLASQTPHPAIDYAEVMLFAAEEQARRGEGEIALERLAAFRQRWPALADVAEQARGRVALMRHDTDGAQGVFRALADAHPDDPELRYEIAEDFVDSGADAELALPWLDEAQSVAERVHDHATLVDIALLRARILHPQTSEIIEE